MGSLDEFDWKTRTFLRLYRWRRLDPVPWTSLARPLSQCRVALVSSAGLVGPGQPDFDPGVRGGDFSYRVLDRDVDLTLLRDSHRSATYDHAHVEADPNVAFPLDRLRELAARGTIAEVAPRHLSFMGSITAPGRLIRRTAPAAAELLAADQVDVALLIPI
ncbi:glycine/sarcosine/betaine reductase selenoprotein B family protein [Haliangium sp.]|uniref:glycine/sarcosine/betaine reductase selenoprotein B family protein n=1 Tax=Haliangium sp. TaxID=2663208 RepID=UPI003D0C1D0F